MLFNFCVNILTKCIEEISRAQILAFFSCKNLLFPQNLPAFCHWRWSFGILCKQSFRRHEKKGKMSPWSAFQKNIPQIYIQVV